MRKNTSGGSPLRCNYYFIFLSKTILGKDQGFMCGRHKKYGKQFLFYWQSLLCLILVGYTTWSFFFKATPPLLPTFYSNLRKPNQVVLPDVLEEKVLGVKAKFVLKALVVVGNPKS